MNQTIIFGNAPLTEQEAAALAGQWLDGRHYDEVIGGEATDVYKEDGGPLLLYRPLALPTEAADRALPALRRAAKLQSKSNRGAATGYVREARHGMMGYEVRCARWPYGRITPFTRDDKEGWQDVQPLLGALNDLYQRELPAVHKVQAQFAGLTSPDFKIAGTVFTSVTVNHNLRFTAHRDAGNLRCGFSVMTVVAQGEYDGGLLVFPQYRIACDLRDRDVLLFESGAWHGNTPLIGIGGEYERISVVCYYRAKMIHCGTAAEEHERAKRHEHGHKLYP
jgi:hypothetical protein